MPYPPGSLCGPWLAGFLLAIPVFLISPFIILIPIGIAVAKEINNKPMALCQHRLIIGDVIAQTYIPPRPIQLAAPDLLGYSLGTQMVVGLDCGCHCAGSYHAHHHQGP